VSTRKLSAIRCQFSAGARTAVSMTASQGARLFFAQKGLDRNSLVLKAES